MDKSEVIREHIRNNFDKNIDWSNPDVRKKTFQELCESENGTKNGITWAKHQTLFIAQFKKVCKEKNLDPQTFGLARPKVEFVKTSSEIKSTITPKPKESKKFQQEQKAAQTQTITIDKDGKPISPTQPTEPEIVITKELVQVTFKTLFGMVRWKFKDFDALTKEEIDSLGTAWLPVFQKYLEQNWLFWGIPLVTTAGIILPRIAKMKNPDEKKEEKKKEKPKEEKKIDTDSEAYKKFVVWQSKHGGDKK